MTESGTGSGQEAPEPSVVLSTNGPSQEPASRWAGVKEEWSTSVRSHYVVKSAIVGTRRQPFGYGSASALIVDELALLMDLKDVYWARDGRKSVDAAVTLVAAGGTFFAGMPFWPHARRRLRR